MPTYDYRCRACGHSFEVFQSMSEGPKRKCPACGQRRLERLIGTGAGIIFKGSGFYETDYRSDAYTKSAEAEKTTQGSEKSSESASDSKASETGRAGSSGNPGASTEKPD